MKSTSTTNFRSKMKEWMDLARTKPVRINRGSDSAVVIIDAEEFEKQQLELASLRGIARGLSEIVQGKGVEHKPGDIAELRKEVKAGVKGKAPKKRTAVG